MNTTIYTNKEIHSIIIPAFKLNGKGLIIESPSYCNESLVEFSEKEEIDIDSVSGTDLISVEFSQTFPACGDVECCGMITYRYVMIIEKDLINLLLKNKNETILEN